MKKKPIRKQLGVRVLITLIEEADNFIDGIRFRSRAHMMEVALQKFLWELKASGYKPRKTKMGRIPK